MRKLEQMTVSEIGSTLTLGDIALYGGLVAIGFVAAVALLAYLDGRGIVAFFVPRKKKK